MANLASSTLGQTTNPKPIQDYTPEKQSPSFSQQINEIFTITNFAGTNQTLTAAQILGGFIIGIPTGAANYTTDTATNILQAMEGAKVGSMILFTVRNKSAGANTITLVGGTGVTINAGDTATVAQNNQKTFMAIVTALPTATALGTITLYSLGTVVF